MGFQLSDTVDKNKIFLVRRSELEGRLDTVFYKPAYLENEQIIKSCKWGYGKLSHLIKRIADGPFGSDLKVDEYQTEGHPLLRVSNIRTGEIGGKLVFISTNKQKQLKRSTVFPGDVLLTKAGAILGYSAVYPSSLKEGNITSHLVTITCSEVLNPHYLSYYFRSALGQLQIYRWGNKSTRPELNTGEVKQILIPTPSIKVQKQIVAQMAAAYDAKKAKEAEAQRLLDSIDDYLLQELAIELPDEGENSIQERTFFQRFSRVSGGRFDPYHHKPFFRDLLSSIDKSKYEVITLGKITRKIVNGYDSRQYTEDGSMYLRVANIGDNEFDLSSVKFIPTTNITKDISLEVGDLLLTRKGSFGNAVIVNAETEDAVISSEIFKISFSKNIQTETRYISEWLNSKIIQLFFERIKTGAIMGHLSQDALVKTPIVVPKMKKQQEIADHVENIRNQAKELRKQAVADLEQAKQEVEAMILGEDE